MKYKVLVNATTLVIGGGIQIGISFIEHASRRDITDIDFVFAVSRALYDNLSAELKRDLRVKVFAVPPARIIRGHKSRSLLKSLEREFQPHIVYTLGFPSYTRFRNVEVGRYTNPWEICPTPLAYSTLSLNQRVIRFLMTQYRLLWAHRGQFLETQTEAAKSGIMARLSVAGDRIKVIPNAPNPRFLSDKQVGLPENRTGKSRIFCLSADYTHKNLPIIPAVAERLKNVHRYRDCIFILTIPEGGHVYREVQRLSRKLGVVDMVQNVGPLRMEECIALYRDADIVFLPTLLEVFSATYIEAMAMSKPIVTTDLDFARDVCGDAALYYSPTSPSAAAQAIVALLRDTDLQAELIKRGGRRLNAFPDAEEKHRMVIDWLREIAAQSCHYANPA